MFEVGGSLLLGSLLFFGLLVSLVAIPIMVALAVVGLVLKLVFFLILAPFRILGWGLGAVLGIVGLALKGVFLLVGVSLLILLGLFPLIPLLLLGGVLYFLLRPRRTTGLTPAAGA